MDRQFIVVNDDRREYLRSEVFGGQTQPSTSARDYPDGAVIAVPLLLDDNQGHAGADFAKIVNRHQITAERRKLVYIKAQKYGDQVTIVPACAGMWAGNRVRFMDAANADCHDIRNGETYRDISHTVMRQIRYFLAGEYTRKRLDRARLDTFQRLFARSDETWLAPTQVYGILSDIHARCIQTGDNTELSAALDHLCTVQLSAAARRELERWSVDGRRSTVPSPQADARRMLADDGAMVAAAMGRHIEQQMSRLNHHYQQVCRSALSSAAGDDHAGLIALQLAEFNVYTRDQAYPQRQREFCRPLAEAIVYYVATHATLPRMSTLHRWVRVMDPRDPQITEAVLPQIPQEYMHPEPAAAVSERCRRRVDLSEVPE